MIEDTDFFEEKLALITEEVDRALKQCSTLETNTLAGKYNSHDPAEIKMLLQKAYRLVSHLSFCQEYLSRVES